MPTKTISYGGFVAPENDMFKPEISSEGFPVQLFASNTPQYSSVENWNPFINQLDIRVRISEIDFGPQFTRVYSNSSNLLVTDIYFLDSNSNKIWYYYKWPLNIPGADIFVDGIVWKQLDSKFLYLVDNNLHTITYKDSFGNLLLTETLVQPYPVFIHIDRIDLSTVTVLDNKTYTIQIENGGLLIVYSKPGLQIKEVDACIFDLEISFEDFYPKITYWPFYVIINVSDNEVLIYDYSTVDSQIKIVNGINTYVYSNIFTLFDYDNTYLISFREFKYSTYQAFVGFNPTKDPSTAYDKNVTFLVLVNDKLVWSSSDQFVDPGIVVSGGNGTWTWTGSDPDIDPPIHAIFSNKTIIKNPISLDYLINNSKPALIKEPTILEDRIKNIDTNVARKSLPRYFLIQSATTGVSISNSYLLLEDGFYFLLENGDRLIL